MARIADAEIDRLKAEVSLERLVEAAGVALTPRGRDLVGLCPFHDDTDPSLVVTPANNLWHCLGSCRAGGSVIDWVMRAEAVSFRHAVELLRNEVVSTGGPRPAKRSSVTRLAAPIAPDEDDDALLADVVAYYHSSLLESPEAIAYLESRALGSDELVARFSLGFANRTLSYRLPHKNRVTGLALRSRLQALGVYRASGHEHLNGSVVVPVFDLTGRVVQLYGRKITSGLRKGTPDHLYLPRPLAGVFNSDALRASREIICCESLIDAMTLWVAGFKNVTAIFGTNGPTHDLIDAFERHGTARVLIAFDSDDAGDAAAATFATDLMGRGIECFRIAFGHGRDANDIAVASASPRAALGRVIRKAEWIGAGARTMRRDAPPREPPVVEPVTESPPRNDDDPFPFLAAEPVAASSLPHEPAALDALDPHVDGDELTLDLGSRRWRVRGLQKVTSYDLLKLNVLVAVTSGGDIESFHVDTFDLYSHRARAAFTKAAADELGVKEDVVKRELGRVLLSCEETADRIISDALSPTATRIEITDSERAAAMDLLTDPALSERIVDDLTALGVVGEKTNKLVAYLAAVSRKLDNPLAIVVQSSPAAGKSSLLDAVVALVPEEERVSFSAMTGQSLYYVGEGDLSHKVLAIAEHQGAERAAYALRLLQSEGELSIASTGKDATTGRLVTHEYRVKGPVAIMLTTTAIDLDEELLSRLVVLTIDEDRAQTKAIHDAQRKAQTLDGLVASATCAEVAALHHNAQRLLAPVAVVNPFAENLTFADATTRSRRDHAKYLALINASTLLHQHQRTQRTVRVGGNDITYVEAALADVELANKVAAEILGRSLDDLAPQTRRLLELVFDTVQGACERLSIERSDFRFTRKDVRDATGWSDFQVRTHLARIVDLEHVLVHRGSRGQSFVYELLYDGSGRDGSPFVSGLIDTEHLNDHNLEGPASDSEGPTSPQRTPLVASSRSAGDPVTPAPIAVSSSTNDKTRPGAGLRVASYR